MQLFGDPRQWPEDDLVGWSESLGPELALAGYASGVFPMPADDVFGWFSPLQRGVLPLDQLKVSRSLRRSMRNYRVTTDRACAEVLDRCADPGRPGGWITDQIRATYLELHAHGFVHSVEVWTPAGELVGGLYGVRLGRLFAGESMFHDPHRGRDASKVALVALVEVLGQLGDEVLDVQWCTDHLASLGVIEVPRDDYLTIATRAARAAHQPWPEELPVRPELPDTGQGS